MFYAQTYEACDFYGLGIVERKRWGSAQPYHSALEG